MKIKDLVNKMENHFISENEEGSPNKFKKETLVTAIKKTLLAVKYNKPVMVYGDYDADGILSSLMMYAYYKKLNSVLNKDTKVDISFSERKTFFGMGKDLYDNLSKEYGLIIMTDNGSEEDFLNENIDNLLVLDHHPTSNDYNYIVNPNINTDKYSTSGGKVVFDFLSILDKNVEKLFKVSLFKDKDFYNIMKELSALTLISDMAKLNNYNRKFIQEALKTVKEKKLPFFAPLKEFTSSEVAFNIIPKINAVSRLEKDLNIVKQWVLPKSLNEFTFADREIKKIDTLKKDIVLKIYSKIEKENFDKDTMFIKQEVVLLKDENIAAGLNGLLANKFLNEYNKPSIVVSAVITEDNKKIYVGSARGTGIKTLFDTISENNPEFFKTGNYGGHLDAMGFTTSDENDLEIIKQNMHLYENKSVFNVLTDEILSLEEYKYIKKSYQDLAQKVDFHSKLTVFIKNDLDKLDKTVYKNYTLLRKDNVKFLIPNTKMEQFENTNYLLVELRVGDIENIKVFLDDKEEIKYEVVKDIEVKEEIKNNIDNTDEVNKKEKKNNINIESGNFFTAIAKNFKK